MFREIMRWLALELAYQEYVSRVTRFYAVSRTDWANWQMTHYRGWPYCDWYCECNVYVVPEYRPFPHGMIMSEWHNRR